MATSGTFASFNVGDLLEEAYERAGLEMRSGYDLRTGIRTFNFLMAEWANRGLNLWTIDEETISVTSGDNTYTATANTIDIIDHVIRDSNSLDTPLERISSTQWAMINKKTQTGKPSLINVERARDATNITLWPVPNANYTLVYWRLRRMEEAGAVGNDPDLPFRFIPALTAGLAYHIALKKSREAERIPFLKGEYEEAFNLAADEDRDRSSLWFVPDLR